MKSHSILTVCFILASYQALSCSCFTDLLANEIRDTPEIFVGRAIKVETIITTEDGYDQETMYTTFEISKSFKGGASNKVVVQTIPDGAACGYVFVEGSNYLLFAMGEYRTGNLTTSLCSRTGDLNRVQNTLIKLEKLGDNILNIQDLSPSELYGNIWLNEQFSSTEVRQKLLLSEAEQIKILNAIPQECFQARPSRYYYSYDISAQGEVSNVESLYVQRNMTNICHQVTVEAILKLAPWEPAQITGINVNTVGYYSLSILEEQTPGR